jgi:hypothetical protein
MIEEVEAPKPFDDELYLYKQKLIKGKGLFNSFESHSLIEDSEIELNPLPLLNTNFAGISLYFININKIDKLKYLLCHLDTLVSFLTRNVLIQCRYCDPDQIGTIP